MGGRLGPCAQKAHDIPQPIRYEGEWIYPLAGRLGPCAHKVHDIPWPIHYEGEWIYPLAGRLGPCAQKAHDIPRPIRYEGEWIYIHWQAGSAHALRRSMIFLGPSAAKGG